VSDFRDGMTVCFAEALRLGLTIGIRPHLVRAASQGNSNGDPTAASFPASGLPALASQRVSIRLNGTRSTCEAPCYLLTSCLGLMFAANPGRRHWSRGVAQCPAA
jgi:hypothetical protein